MILQQLLAVGIGGAIGAVIRWCISNYMNRRGKFPTGTFLVNSTGSFLIGLIVGMQLSMMATLFLVTGVAGGLTTFSTLNKELLSFWTDKKRLFFMYLFSTYSLGILLAFIGYSVGRSL